MLSLGTFTDSFPDTNGQACSPPEELDSSLMFLSQEPTDDDEKYLPEEFLTDDDIDYSNTSDIVDLEDDTDDPFEDIEDGGDAPYQNFYPNGTVVKFKCSQSRQGKYSSWQIR